MKEIIAITIIRIVVLNLILMTFLKQFQRKKIYLFNLLLST
jgi:hypothetical protein